MVHLNTNLFSISKNIVVSNKNFKIVEFNNIVSNFGKYLKKGMLTIIPEEFGCNAEADGFFISILKRIK